jgi:hypothetical protein
MQDFIQGIYAPFDLPICLPAPPSDWTSTEPFQSGFEQDASNLRQDWINVGNYINNAIITYERESVSNTK